MPLAGTWQEVINSDSAVYAGSDYGNGGGVVTEELPSHGQGSSLALNLPPLGVLILRPVAG